jgi:hypothetical protein
MKKTEVFAMLGCLTVAIVMIAIPSELKAQQCYAELYSENPDYVTISVDTRGLENNVLLSRVRVTVSYRVGEREANKTWFFTGTELPSLKANKVYRRYLALNEGPAVEIIGGGLDYTEGPGGANYDTASIHKERNPGKAPANALVIGVVPPTVAVPPTISGEWQFTTNSSVSGETHRGILTLSLSGNSVNGTIETFDRSNVEITGNYDANSGALTLSRDTGQETTQKYALQKNGAIFSGKFWNEGKFEDSGTIEIVRSPKESSGMRVEVH